MTCKETSALQVIRVGGGKNMLPADETRILQRV